jgi:hypothetical protein
MATDRRKRRPRIIAACFSFFMSMSRVAGPSYEEASCAVIRRIMAVTASQRLMLQNVNGGSCVDYSSSIW